MTNGRFVSNIFESSSALLWAGRLQRLQLEAFLAGDALEPRVPFFLSCIPHFMCICLTHLHAKSCLRLLCTRCVMQRASCWPQVRHMADYEIEVLTSDKRGAGTDALVYLQVEGSEGVLEEKLLENSSGNFQRGK